MAKVPKLASKNRRLESHYAIKMTKEMRLKLEELKIFHGIDVPEWIRGLIYEQLGQLHNVIESAEKK